MFESLRSLARPVLGPPRRRVRHLRALRSSNVGKWSQWYKGVDKPQAYDDTESYAVAADFLNGCSLVEDWGCGKGWMRTLIADDRYRGVDGSVTPFTDVVADLVKYRSSVPGVFMRHVLEHNYQWEKILDNTLASFSERMVLVTFTPFAETAHEIAFNDSIGVPDLSFRLSDITDRFPPDVEWRMETLVTKTQYNTESIFFLTRHQPGNLAAKK